MRRHVSSSVFMAALSLILLISTASCGAGEIPPTPTPTVTDTPLPTHTPLPTSTPTSIPTATPPPLGLEGSLSKTIETFQNLGCTVMEPTDPESTSLDCSDELGVNMLFISTSPDLPSDTMLYADLYLTLKEGANDGWIVTLLFEDRQRALVTQYLLNTVPMSYSRVNSWMEEQISTEGSDLFTYGAASADIDGLYVSIGADPPRFSITIWGRQ